MDLDRPNTLRITCAPEAPAYLTGELEAMGFAVEHTDRTAVEITGSLRDAMRLNLHLRTAFHVLYLLADFECVDPDELYDEARKLPWEEIIPAEAYLSVDARGRNPTIRNWTFAALRLKDAIVDRMQEKRGVRPQYGPERSGVVISLLWLDEHSRVYLNTTGNKLSDRGYRRIPFKAPMQETLAAAVLLAAGYDGSVPLVNPMCGSGTLAIEAALIAMNRAPGLLRSNFGLMHVLGFDDAVWQAARREAAKARKGAAPAPIIASDIDPEAVEIARKNAQTAGVDTVIQFHVCDFAETPLPPPVSQCDSTGRPGVIVMNPEYGERMGDAASLPQVYEKIGDYLKQKCAGYKGYVFSGNRELAKHIGLRAKRRIPFFNAEIECRLLEYELYQGSRD